MVRRIEYTTLSGELIGSQPSSMSPEEFGAYARERLEGEAKRITQPYDPNRSKIVEVVRLTDDANEVARLELGDVIVADASSKRAGPN